MILKKIFFLSVCSAIAAVNFTGSVSAQDRARVVKPNSSQPVNQPPVSAPAPEQKSKLISSSHPVLTTKIDVAKPDSAVDVKPAPEPLVIKTASSKPVNAAPNFAAAKTAYGPAVSVKLDQAIKSRYGIHYRYGTTGPNSYDCSGFVWSSFQEAGVNFTRASARSLWTQSEPVDGDDRYKFGTLVFLNGLGHMGIVADENGFYHASSSKGITYSPFKGYWENRIVGFRKLKPETSVATGTSTKQ